MTPPTISLPIAKRLKKGCCDPTLEDGETYTCCDHCCGECLEQGIITLPKDT